MVGGEAREAAAEAGPASGLGRQLQDLYDLFMDREPPVLRRLSNRQLSLEACRDCVDEAFMRVLSKAARGDLDEGVKLAAYVRRTARNLALDSLRADRRLDLMNGADLEASLSVLPEAEEVDVLNDLVIPAIEAMPVSERRHVAHLQSQGLTDIEIAAALGVGAARVHRERYNAVLDLRRALAEFIRHRHQKKPHVRKER
ncbi:sigma-70 family RNA polymerase sigma factor [Streptomyces sp. ASQP_92]|uniref:sigma-70 family RNA polymerase sigma factor n=1 Tax=Streptomyces sp. ASQP_92 TaxID=2979116 RepID=UPI0021BFD488|nr:sigma-70 family RNA polymerase sigma factor [Streptomyces sp. ASQP_92]MCT9092499.1 sigma-70 family RNA polymerase sigma factor [Streptomyces sp. ASQP_92]